MAKMISPILVVALGILLLPRCYATEAGPNVHIKELNDGLIAYAIGDFSTAFQVLNILAEKDVPLAQLFTGRMYKQGLGVSQNCERALTWLKRGAMRGNAEAAFDVGLLNERGECVPQSEAEALAWYQLAAENGDIQAANVIGEIYLGRGDVAPDFKKAAYWFLRGTKDYDANAYFHLGQLYESGNGVPKDLVQAYVWYEVCVAISFPANIGEPTKGIIARDNLREKLMPLMVAEGHRRAFELMAHWDHPNDEIAEQKRVPGNLEQRSSLR